MKWLCDKHPSGKCWLVSLGDGLEIYVDTEEQARLIAAAPDLLDALATLYYYLMDNDVDGLTGHAEEMTAARHAITKATGVMKP